MRLSVNGYLLSDAQINAGLAAMMGVWTAKDIEQALISAGVPRFKTDFHRQYEYATAMRAADRLLQKERIAGRIQPNPDKRGEWIWA